ncbi:hypothetical protein LXA43DRAFT_78805 [Ganoderma leucocontextum]|nr:hypothetical protein LXA43DRAFT_78805 [Ganoderma leucocontextum]
MVTTANDPMSQSCQVRRSVGHGSSPQGPLPRGRFQQPSTPGKLLLRSTGSSDESVVNSHADLWRNARPHTRERTPEVQLSGNAQSNSPVRHSIYLLCVLASDSPRSLPLYLRVKLLGYAAPRLHHLSRRPEYILRLVLWVSEVAHKTWRVRQHCATPYLFLLSHVQHRRECSKTCRIPVPPKKSPNWSGLRAGGVRRIEFELSAYTERPGW